jgi:hypothetical protein
MNSCHVMPCGHVSASLRACIVSVPLSSKRKRRSSRQGLTRALDCASWRVFAFVLLLVVVLLWGVGRGVRWLSQPARGRFMRAVGCHTSTHDARARSLGVSTLCESARTYDTPDILLFEALRCKDTDLRCLVRIIAKKCVTCSFIREIEMAA